MSLSDRVNERIRSLIGSLLVENATLAAQVEELAAKRAAEEQSKPVVTERKEE